MKLYDMIQVYSSGSTVIMNMHCIWPVLHMTSCLVAINKNRDMCLDMKNCNKKKNFPIFQWGNPCERLSECVEGVEIYKINLKKLRISKVSCKESSRSESLTEINKYKRITFLNYNTMMAHNTTIWGNIGWLRIQKMSSISNYQFSMNKTEQKNREKYPNNW